MLTNKKHTTPPSLPPSLRPLIDVGVARQKSHTFRSKLPAKIRLYSYPALPPSLHPSLSPFLPVPLD